MVDLRPKPRKPFKELLVSDIGMAVTENIAQDFNGDSGKALRSSIRKVSLELGIRNLKKWPVKERVAFERWCPMLALIPELGNWGAKDRKLLIEIIRSRAAEREKKYVALMQKHELLRESFTKLISR